MCTNSTTVIKVEVKHSRVQVQLYRNKNKIFLRNVLTLLIGIELRNWGIELSNSNTLMCTTSSQIKYELDSNETSVPICIEKFIHFIKLENICYELFTYT